MSGGLVVQYDGRRACPSELIRSRRSVGGNSELLIRWKLVSMGDGGSGGGSSEDSVMMWMCEEDARYSCNDLRARQSTEDQSDCSTEQGQDQLELQEDVRSLVLRAHRQMRPPRSAALSHTVSVLSSYAAIASLAPVFRETGALDLILELLCDTDRETRRSAGQILRALASHDAGSRASVLLALTHRDLELDFENRLTLLELFAETTSSEEQGSFDSAPLPQIPGKALFSLVKRYLRVTSLVDSAPPLDVDPALWLRREFEVAMATAALVSDLVRVLGWDRTQVQTQPSRTRKSIFKPNGQLERSSISQSQRSIAAAPQKEFRTLQDFGSRAEYESYLQQTLRAGTRVRLTQDYEEVHSGDQGEFRTSNNGSPPVQVYWDTLGRTYWVHWHMLEIISSSPTSDQDQSKDQIRPESKPESRPDLRESRLNPMLPSEPMLLRHSLYTCPYLSSGEQKGAELTTGEWWELLFFVKRLEQNQQEQVRTLLQRTLQEGELDDSALIGLSVPISVAMQLLPLLEQNLPPLSLKELQRSYCFSKLRAETLPRTKDSEQSSSDVSAESVSKKPKTETLPLPQALVQPEVQPEVSAKDETRTEAGAQGFPPDLDQMITVFSERIKDKRPLLEKLSETVTVLEKERETRDSGAERSLQFAAVIFMIRTLDQHFDDRDKTFTETNARSRILKLLVDLLSSQSEALVWSCLGLVRGLLKKFDWRVPFSTEGGVRAVLSAMSSFCSSARVQKGALQTLQLLTGVGSASPLPEGGAQVVREVFASISSATPRGSRGLLGAIPAALQLLLQREKPPPQLHPEEAQINPDQDQDQDQDPAHGLEPVWSRLEEVRSNLESARCGLNLVRDLKTMRSVLKEVRCSLQPVRSVLQEIRGLEEERDAEDIQDPEKSSEENTESSLDQVRAGLLVLSWLLSHTELKEALESCDLSSVLKQCVSDGVHPALALSVLQAMCSDLDLDLPESQVRTLLSGLKEPAASKEVIRTLEKVLCDAEAPEGAAAVKQVMQNADILLDVVSLMETHKSDKTTLLSLHRILGKFLDSFDEDFPWHNVIEPCLSSINLHLTDKQLCQVSVGLLLRLAGLDKDFGVLMVRFGAGPVLDRVLEKHESLQSASDLKDLVQDLNQFSGLYKTLGSSILSGCIQLVLGQIEEHRRSHRPINIPLFDMFLHHLCQGSGAELREDQCWEKVEVSSNQHRAKNLTDQNPKTFWESNGCSGSHHITVHLRRGVAIRELAVLLSSDDSSYMPAKIMVYGGDDLSSVSTELNTVNVAPSASRVVLLQNQTRFWPVIQIRIKRCQQGGIDTRVRGLEVLGPKPTFWPVFRDQLCLRSHLFYSCKAHSWSRQIQADRNQLLSIYHKLNAVLKLEQSFADRFLPDAEASSALGQTVWDALVCPLVHAVTSSDSPALAWLLSQYLENSDSSRRWKSRTAIFNSRVRRLVHLLVHVDTRPAPEPELRTSTDGAKESKPGAKAKERSSSISDMALCWQGVVQQQVGAFLSARLEDEDFSEHYSDLFQSLLRSTTELFHKHQAFAVALRQGFSSALLQLSVSQGVTVSERFARYIGQMISQVGAPGVEGEESAEKLQKFLEPTLFLCGLELATSFEHFYRRFLGERLLLNGHLWLESAVIGQIGACFPARSPQQMLLNLRESEDMQRHFSLHQLHRLDHELDQDRDLDSDQDLSQDQDRDVELDLDQFKTDSDQTPEVQILVLSPRCWSVSSQFYLDQGRLQLLPKSLLKTLQLYQDFYQHYQTETSQSCSSPRRLQWTCLGRAEIRFGSWTFTVSTVQMLILLQFNHSQEISLEALMLQTGLSEPVLLHALQPLTSTEGPLTHGGPNQDQSVVRVNPQVELRSQNSSLHVRLAPDENYRSAHEDAAAILEQKRNFLLCAIVRILKRERELHIDHLIYKVLDFCQKQPPGCGPSSSPGSGPGPSSDPGFSPCSDSGPPRFSCSSADVLSCLMHLFSKNLVQRKPDRPQILEYLPEVQTSPRGQALDYSHTETSLVLEDLSLDSGRTMTQDEVRDLMKKTIQQVSGVLSVDEDWAEHLLVLNLWDVERVVQRFTDHHDDLLREAGLSVSDPAPSVSDSLCPVCLSSGSEGTPTLSCGHFCCQSCWEEYLTSRIEQNLVLSCNCPITDCTAQATPSFYRRVLSDQGTLRQYEGALVRSYVDSCSNLTWCTNPSGCDRVLLRQTVGDFGSCAECRWTSCFNCSFTEAHFPCSCSQIGRWVDDGGFYEGMSVEAQSKHLAKLISKRCPQCSTAIEKNEGCLHMTCAKCSHGFCWRCLKPWKPTHKDYYNCSASVSKAARQGKKFQDFNEKCTFQHQAKDFAQTLVHRVSSLSDTVPVASLSFVLESCRVLVQSRKVLGYSCVYSYYSQSQEQSRVQTRAQGKSSDQDHSQDHSQEQLDLLEQQTEALELHTTALQVLLEEALLQSTDLASSLRLIKPDQIQSGLELVHRVQERLRAILLHSTQDFRLGCESRSQEGLEASELTNSNGANKESKSDSDSDQDPEPDQNRNPEEDDYDDYDDYDEDEEYVPDYDYDEDDIDEEYYSDYDQDYSPYD